MNLVNWFVFFLSLALINTFLAAIGVKRFLSLHSFISSHHDLESFKQMVRRQMYQALMQIGFLGIANIVGLYGIITRQISLLLILILDGAIIIISKFIKKTEEQARTLKVSDANLESQYRDICEAWTKKALPDF